MKFEPTHWTIVQEGADYEAKQNRVFLRAPFKIAAYVSTEGVEALAGVGYEIDAKVPQGSRFRAEAVTEGQGVIFAYSPTGSSFKPTGEIFTNADRKPMESGMLAEVTRATRLMRLEHKRMLDEIRANNPRKPKAQQLCLNQCENSLQVNIPA